MIKNYFKHFKGLPPPFLEGTTKSLIYYDILQEDKIKKNGIHYRLNLDNGNGKFFRLFRLVLANFVLKKSSV